MKIFIKRILEVTSYNNCAQSWLIDEQSTIHSKQINELQLFMQACDTTQQVSATIIITLFTITMWIMLLLFELRLNVHFL